MIIDGHGSAAHASVQNVVCVCKAVFTVFGACRRGTASVRMDRSVGFGQARGGIDFGQSSFVRWSQHGIQRAQFLEQLIVHRCEASDGRLQLPGGPCRRKRCFLRLSADLVGLLGGFGEDLFGLGLGCTENLVNVSSSLDNEASENRCASTKSRPISISVVSTLDALVSRVLACSSRPCNSSIVLAIDCSSALAHSTSVPAWTSHLESASRVGRRQVRHRYVPMGVAGRPGTPNTESIGWCSWLPLPTRVFVRWTSRNSKVLPPVHTLVRRETPTSPEEL